MTRLDAGPMTEEVCPAAVERPGPRAIVLDARAVPLGGLRAMTVSRALPQRRLTTVGAWCFLDRFGPQTARMRVEPHPHMGLQTVTWPLVGEVRHRDSLGSDVVLRRGSLNLMTSGAGIAHSEYSVGDGPIELDALQLWVALPDPARRGESSFETHTSLPTLDLGGATAIVFMGELAGTASPATVHTPLVGAEIALPAGADATVPLDPAWEHAVVLLSGDVSLHGAAGDLPAPPVDGLTYLGTDRDGVGLRSDTGAVVMLLGGEPFPDDLVMWWNFVGRDHEEIATARHDWESRSARFGQVPGHDTRVPAPPLPPVTLQPRRRQL